MKMIAKITHLQNVEDFNFVLASIHHYFKISLKKCFSITEKATITEPSIHLRPNMLPPRTWKLAGAGASSSNSSGSSSVAQDLGRSRDWTR